MVTAPAGMALTEKASVLQIAEAIGKAKRPSVIWLHFQDCTAAGCPFQALSKDPETGVVSWTAEKCIGCRYCTITCPYHIPRFQWGGIQSARHEVRIVQSPPERWLETSAAPPYVRPVP